MAFCSNCGSQVPDGASNCPNCGQALVAAAVPAPKVDLTDHTADFDAKDISENKVTAMASYLLGTVGIIISLLAASDSKFAGFHARQSLKLSIVNMLLLLATALLAWTFIVPLAGVICIGIVFVVRIICFVYVCQGKAKEAPIINKLPFLK